MTEAITRTMAAACGLIAAFDNALMPTGETKAAYSGEFSFTIPEMDEDGEEHQRRIDVPWTTIKEIMAAIRAKAISDRVSRRSPSRIADGRGLALSNVAPPRGPEYEEPEGTELEPPQGGGYEHSPRRKSAASPAA